MSGGVIRIYSESPYEQLEPSVEEWLNHLKQMWPIWKKSSALSYMLVDFFSSSKEPFASALQIMVSSGDFYSGKQNSLAMHIMETFSYWLRNNNGIEISKRLKQDAINLVIKQKNLDLIKLVIDTFRIRENRDVLVGPVHQLAESKKYKEACQLASILNLHDCFGITEFVIPLVFQDKYVIAAQFLEGSRKHQEELAVFLDNLIGKKSVMNEAQGIIVRLNIHDARFKSLGYKPLSKLLTRIIKAFNIPPTTCPNLTQKRGKGILQFLMHKRYVEKSIGRESWAEMVLEAIGDDESLQVQLVQNVAVYGDLKEALTWAEKFGTPRELWPVKLQKFSQRLVPPGGYVTVGGGLTRGTDFREENEMSNSPENFEEENWDAETDATPATPALKFHKLPIEESQIRLIDTSSSFCSVISDLSNGVPIVGIDAEWKPSFGFSECNLALIQIATDNVVYILDVITLARDAPQVLWERFANVFIDSPKILKLGFGVSTDLVIVKETFRKLHGIKTGSDVGFLDLAVLWKTLVNDYKFVFPFSSTSKASENLNCLIEKCLGESLDKSDQFSNWENRPLRKSQIVYAALDAYCLLEAYKVIVTESKSQNIPISEIVEEIVYGSGPKKRTTKEKKKKRSRYHNGKKKSSSNGEMKN